MRVLQVNATYATGSTGEIVCGIAHAGHKRGVETYFASSVPPEISGNDTVYVIGSSFDHKCHALCSRILGSQGMYSYLETKKFLNWVDEIQPDIIHLHNLHNNYINIPLLFNYIRKNKVQTVITLHDCWFFTGKCCHFLYDGCNRWTVGCGKCPRQKKDIPSYFLDRSASDFSQKSKLIGENPFVHVIGCSQWLTNCASNSLLSNRVEKTIYNGIDLNVFHPTQSDKKRELHLDDKFVVLGMANKWLSEDNIKTFEYIVSNLDKSIVLLLVGCSEGQMQQNTIDNVLMKGFVKSRTELAEYYSISDVFVNVTKVDSLPTVNIESIACGTPVITYDSGGSKEIIDELTGLSVAYGDYDSLLKCIYEIRNNTKAFYSEKCRKRAEMFYNKDNRFAEYVDLYYRLVC